MNNQYHEELLKNQESQGIDESPLELKNELSLNNAEDNLKTENQHSSDLKEFGVDTNEPDLFSSDNQISSSEDLLGSSDENNEEDDLEIPAFLRRQKN